jgi:hypothetical protein
MRFDILIFLTLLVLLATTLTNAVANWRLQSTVREMAKLLASRNYSDYAMGERTLATPPKVKREISDGYEALFETRAAE